MIRRVWAIPLIALFLASCGEQNTVAGNSVIIGNNTATGIVLNPDGSPAPGVIVECTPDSTPAWNARPDNWSTVSDNDGRYHCSDLPTGHVGVAAYSPASGLTHWHEVNMDGAPSQDSIRDTLAAPGRLYVALPPNTNGIILLSGLPTMLSIHGDQILELTGIPAGWRGDLRLASSTTAITVVDSNLHVDPAGIDSAGYTRRSITLRVPLAGGLASDLIQFPLLLRLDSSWQGFAASLPDGSDLRLSTAGGKALPLTVAAWDRANRTGALWTILDTLVAPGDSVEAVLSWGVPVPGSHPVPAFATDRGWIAAWPLGDTSGTAMDRLDAFPGTISKLTTVAGVIRSASRFDGHSSQIIVTGSETGALAFPEGGPFTWTCWARPALSTSRGHVMGHGLYGPNIQFDGTGDSGIWAAQESRSSPSGWDYLKAPADTGTWAHLALTVSGSSIALYVNGTRQYIDSLFWGNSVGRRAAPFLIGTSIDTLGLTSTTNHFVGDIEEVWVQSVARSPDWIRLVGANQKPGGSVAHPVK